MVEVLHLSLRSVAKGRPNTTVAGIYFTTDDAYWTLIDMVSDLHYRSVALVDCDTLSEAFIRTLSSDHNWMEDSMVTPLVPPSDFECRDTHIGDLLRDRNGHFHFVDMTRFIKLNMGKEFSVQKFCKAVY